MKKLKPLKSAHDLTRTFDALERDGVDRLVLDMLSEGVTVSIGSRYIFKDHEVLVAYVTKPRKEKK